MDELRNDEMSKLFKKSKSPELYGDFIRPISNLIGDICSESIITWKDNRQTINTKIENVLKIIEEKAIKNKEFHEFIISDRNYRVKGNFGLSAPNAVFAYLYDNYIKDKTILQDRMTQRPLTEQLKVIMNLIRVNRNDKDSMNCIGWTINGIINFIKEDPKTGYHPLLYYLVFIYAYCLFVTFFSAGIVEDGINEHLLNILYMTRTEYGIEPMTNEEVVKEFITNYYQERNWKHRIKQEDNIIGKIYIEYTLQLPLINSMNVSMTARDRAINSLIILMTIMYYYSIPDETRRPQQFRTDRECIFYLMEQLSIANFNVKEIDNVLNYIVNVNEKTFVSNFFGNRELFNVLSELYLQQIVPILQENLSAKHSIKKFIHLLSEPKYLKETIGKFIDNHNYRAANIYHYNRNYVYIPLKGNNHIAITDNIFNENMQPITGLETIEFENNPGYIRKATLDDLLIELKSGQGNPQFVIFQGGHTAIELFELIIILIAIIIVIVVAIYVVKRFTLKRPCQMVDTTHQKYN